MMTTLDSNPEFGGEPMPRGILDQIAIEADEDDPWNINAKWRGLQIDYVWASLENGRLKINDFVVDSSRPMPWTIFDGLRLLLNISCPRRNFRGHGIGSRLMDAVIGQAQRTGVSEIWGSVTADDIERTDHLLRFYESRGFKICDPDEDCLKNAARKIVLPFAPKN